MNCIEFFSRLTPSLRIYICTPQIPSNYFLNIYANIIRNNVSLLQFLQATKQNIFGNKCLYNQSDKSIVNWTNDAFQAFKERMYEDYLD